MSVDLTKSVLVSGKDNTEVEEAERTCRDVADPGGRFFGSTGLCSNEKESTFLSFDLLIEQRTLLFL